MNLNDDKEQNQNVEPKYIDPEAGLEIELSQDKLYSIKSKRKLKIVKATVGEKSESMLDKLDHQIYEEFEEIAFLTDAYLEEIIRETRDE